MPSLAGTIAVKTCMAASMEWGNQAAQKGHGIKNFCSRCEVLWSLTICCAEFFFISDFVGECVKPGRGVSWPPHYHISPRCCAETETFSIFLWCPETLSWYPCIAGLDGMNCKWAVQWLTYLNPKSDPDQAITAVPVHCSKEQRHSNVATLR